MKLELDRINPNYLLDLCHSCINVASPVGYYPEIHAWLKERVTQLGYELTFDNKATAYVRVEGVNAEKSVCVGAHLDTIGLIVRGFNEDGSLRVRQLGGINYHSIEGETVSVICRDGSHVPGQVVCSRHSVHVFEDAKTIERTENTMFVEVIGDVSSVQEARALGISEGAVVSVDPHFERFESGHVVSRYIDNKAAVAVLLDSLRWLKETDQKPLYTTYFAFPIYEEVGNGGTWVPRECSEYVALDISLIGPDYAADEHSVGVIVADHKGPYDWNLSNTLIECAREVCTPGKWNTQVAFRYSTDANAAYYTANNLAGAAFGMACTNTHGRERTHVDSLVETAKLTRAYLAGMGR